MAVSNEFIAIGMAMLLLYFWGMQPTQQRWIRMISSSGFIACGIVLVSIGDNIAMFLLFGISIIIGGITLFQDVAALVGRGQTSW